MFNFLKEIPQTYTWPVELMVPINGGKRKKITFEAEFNRKSKTETQKLLAAARTVDENWIQSIEFAPIIEEVLIGINAKDESGKSAPLPDDIKEELLEITGAEAAIFNAYMASLSQEKTKN